jgi:hypothetical protein
VPKNLKQQYVLISNPKQYLRKSAPENLHTITDFSWTWDFSRKSFGVAGLSFFCAIFLKCYALKIL